MTTTTTDTPRTDVLNGIIDTMIVYLETRKSELARLEKLNQEIK